MIRKCFFCAVFWWLACLAYAQDGYPTATEKDGKYGVEDSTGKVLVPFMYDGLHQSSLFPHLFVARQGNLWGIINDKNKPVLPLAYETEDEWGSTFNLDGNAYFDSSAVFVLKYKGKWGLIDYNAKRVVPFEYGVLHKIGFSDSAISQKYLAKKGKKFGIIDRQNKILTPFIYDDFLGFFKSEYAIMRKAGKLLFLDAAGKESTDLSPELTSLDTTNHIHVAVIDDNGKKGVINAKLKITVPCEYNEINVNYSNDFFQYRENGKLGLLSQTGARLTLPMYDEMAGYPRENNIPVRIGNFWGIIDFAGKPILPCEYEEVDDFEEDRPDAITNVKKNGKIAFVNRAGIFLTPFIYTYVHQYVGAPYGVERDEKWGYIDETGKEIIPCQFQQITGFFGAPLTPVKKNDKWGYINLKGEVIIPFKYDKAEVFRGGFASIMLGGRQGKIDKAGKEYWQ